MSNYTVKEEKYGTAEETRFYVAFNDQPVIGFNCCGAEGELHEATARVIAFALNTIAEGDYLMRVAPNDSCDGVVYNGPTEQIRTVVPTVE